MSLIARSKTKRRQLLKGATHEKAAESPGRIIFEKGGAKAVTKRRAWTSDEVDALKAANLKGAGRDTRRALADRLGRTPTQVKWKIAALRQRGELADSPPPTGKRSKAR